jgi:hypothetical protein
VNITDLETTLRALEAAGKVLVTLFRIVSSKVNQIAVVSRDLAALAPFAEYTFDWTSDANGNYTSEFLVPSGYLRSIRFIPGTGSVQPTNQYDVTLVDGIGVNLLGSVGADLSNVTATLAVFTQPIPWNRGLVTLTISAAGAAKTGKVVLLATESA